MWTSDEGESMWCVVMFDLPVKTAEERRRANGFRHLLLDIGFWRAQLSVYVRYTPRAGGSRMAIQTIQANLPPGGEVRIVHVTDLQWAKGLRFSSAQLIEQEPAPTQLTFF